MVLVLKKTREFWFLLRQHQRQNCCHGNTNGVIWFLITPPFSTRPCLLPRPALLSDLPHWPTAWNRLITKSYWTPIDGNQWFLNTFGWLSIGHRLADTNRCQLTNMHRLVSIDRLLFRSSIFIDWLHPALFICVVYTNNSDIQTRY